MTAKHLRDGLALTRRLMDWIRATTVQESAIQATIRDKTENLPMARMMIPPEQGKLLGLLARMLGARKVIEIGSFTGYSATWLVDAVGPDGAVIACDLSEEYLAIARQHWRDGGIADRIEVMQGPAEASLETLLAQGAAGTVDMVFVDADKTGYPVYYELALKLLRPGGAVVFDNALWSGSVADEDNSDASTVALRDLAGVVAADPRVYCAMLTDGDGLLVAYKLGQESE